MKMEKSDIEKRVNLMRENAKNNPNKNNFKNPNKKECPFRDKICGPHCKLFRPGKEGYECPFQEIPSISWNLKAFIKKLIG